MFWVRAFEVLLLVIIPAVQMILKFLGIGAVVYFGVSIAIGTLVDYIKESLGAVPAQMLSILGLMHFDIAVNLYVSAVIASMVLKGFDKATDKKKTYKLTA